MRNLFWNIPFYIDPTTSLYSKKAFIKRENEESFWNIPCLEDEEDSKLKFIPSYQSCSYSSLNGGLL